MNYRIVDKGTIKYLYFDSAETPISTKQHALDLIVICWEQGLQEILIHADALSEEFFLLRTGLAGEILQKFVNYQMRAAVIVPDDQVIKGKSSEMLAELNRGNIFRAFPSYDEAEQWLVGT
ncbi:DUF4180 domain-containing protein [Paenibacillus aurantiacus]|uniref:DUF4180 domain-containing protein n=1 Tax=Paenibacillus aurantiacus TaxID=1936118 RepID=A0ABV5KRJ8_9BACL